MTPWSITTAEMEAFLLEALTGTCRCLLLPNMTVDCRTVYLLAFSPVLQLVCPVNPVLYMSSSAIWENVSALIIVHYYCLHVLTSVLDVFFTNLTQHLLQFNWHGVPEREKLKHNNTAEAVWSPTMAGGLFAIDRKFFERLGTYDSGFDIWGGENLELSFKVYLSKAAWIKLH
jgi:hypothetical protein